MDFPSLPQMEECINHSCLACNPKGLGGNGSSYIALQLHLLLYGQTNQAIPWGYIYTCKTKIIIFFRWEKK